VDLEAQTVTDLPVTLERIDLGTIAVSSDPPGADAWVDEVWQGRTPLPLERPGEKARLVLSLPDGPEASLEIGPSSPTEVSVSLSAGASRSDAAQKAARDRFYGSFGWFVLSLPVPFYTYSWSVDWAAEARRLAAAGDTTGAQRAVNIGTGFWFGYLGGLAVSVGLAGWTAYNIVRYIQAASQTAGGEVNP
jgi:hypothetical protein